MKVTAEYAYINLRHCSQHFTDSCFMNVQERRKLVWDAVPTLFDIPNPPRKSPKRKPPKLRDPPPPAKKKRWLLSNPEKPDTDKPDAGSPSLPGADGHSSSLLDAGSSSTIDPDTPSEPKTTHISSQTGKYIS
ncbi:THAP domain-containing protein 8-like [Portunus trituberculatus]|uniref:THAP domain-containing protein 8-like n=1 Tax=Portunus trituberculatus TaxID=210409 RepID=UPI001E1CD2A5|nr:THAP domain-containing protein 8-like [Portunus trituberculatus]